MTPKHQKQHFYGLHNVAMAYARDQGFTRGLQRDFADYYEGKKRHGSRMSMNAIWDEFMMDRLTTEGWDAKKMWGE